MKRTLIVLKGTFPEIQAIIAKMGHMTLGELARLQDKAEVDK